MQDTPTFHPLDGSFQQVFGTSEAQRFRIFPSTRQNPRGTVSPRESSDFPAQNRAGRMVLMPGHGAPGTPQSRRRLVILHAVQCCVAILAGAVLALAIHDAPAKIAATVLDAREQEGW